MNVQNLNNNKIITDKYEQFLSTAKWKERSAERKSILIVEF